MSEGIAFVAGAVIGAVGMIAALTFALGTGSLPECDRPGSSGDAAGHGSTLIYHYSPSQGDDLEDTEQALERMGWHTNTTRTDDGWQLTARCSWP